MEYVWEVVKNGSQTPHGGVPFTLLRKGESGRGTGFRESQEFCLYILYRTLRHPTRNVKKALGYMSLEIKGVDRRYTFESCQHGGTEFQTLCMNHLA